MRKKWFALKENLARNKLKPKYTATEWALKQICTTTSTDEYPIISSISKIAYIIPVSNAWPERGGSAKKRDKNEQTKHDGKRIVDDEILNIGGKTVNSAFGKKYGERRRYKQAKEMGTQTSVGCTQLQCTIESEFQIQAEERLDTIINSEKYIVSNIAELSDNESDSDDE